MERATEQKEALRYMQMLALTGMLTEHSLNLHP